MASITQEQLKIIEQTRQRLVNLTQSLGSLVNNISQSQPLPAWSSLQSQATIISNNLLTISQLLHEHRDLFSSLVVYPTPAFPGRTESSMLNQLMRTKLEPRVEDWLAHGRSVGREALEPSSGDQQQPTADNTSTSENGANTQRLSGEDLQALWEWAPIEANMEARRRNWGGDYTIEEKEAGLNNVITGLARKLNENVEGAAGRDLDESEDEDEVMEGTGEEVKAGASIPSRDTTTMPLDDFFRYMMTGAEPRPR
ncbi:Mediator of RNA polymerase II transcription subunit 8 [Trichophyton interdigitale]|uniref:Mediator of RNA polymerase II transcription subunit 8 n=1 Tax=Trichophyton interdigitale TaxID=101480 RepID=A0A9P5CYD2_9EURO|nr:Mediator of RNA polymerase II transcription subunit 8 [Trichophyton interdigitale]KAF3894375.1 Mediator of RNA polymerase II transcription subunit 8 [Trichophyton interdigitale]KAG8207974.1 Mediator of RNA polymerase II transcription subunit 8 [Trichophyton interdigitale]